MVSYYTFLRFFVIFLQLEKNFDEKFFVDVLENLEKNKKKFSKFVFNFFNRLKRLQNFFCENFFSSCGKILKKN
jgi:hypothetical protein